MVMKKKWLGVALDIYDDPDNGRNLVACNKAINGWRNLLENQFGFEHIATKTNSPITDKNATRSNVLMALENMVESASENDIHVFVFVGHGDFQKDSFSILQDELLFEHNDCHDEKILLFGPDQITDDELRALLNKNPKKGLFIFIFDCCYAGNIKSHDISQEEYDKIEQAKTIEFIRNYIQKKSNGNKANNAQDNWAYENNTHAKVISKHNVFTDIQTYYNTDPEEIALLKANIKNSIDALTKKYPSTFLVKDTSNLVIPKDAYFAADLGIIEKNIIDLGTRLFMRRNAIDIDLQKNEILLCATSAYKKTYQPEIDGEHQSAFSYFMVKTIEEYLYKDESLNYKKLIELTTEKMLMENVDSYPQLIVSKTNLSTKQIFNINQKMMSNTVTYPRNLKELNQNILLNLALNDSENFQIIHNEISKEHAYCVLVRMKDASEVQIEGKTCYEIASMEFHVVQIFNQDPTYNSKLFAINNTRANGFVNLSSSEDVAKHHTFHDSFGNMLCLDVHLTFKDKTATRIPAVYSPDNKLILERNQVLHFAIFVDEKPVDNDTNYGMAAGGKQCSTRNIWVR
jgi:hypothetical protein